MSEQKATTGTLWKTDYKKFHSANMKLLSKNVRIKKLELVLIQFKKGTNRLRYLIQEDTNTLNSGLFGISNLNRIMF